MMALDPVPVPARIRILIADDHPIVRKGLCQIVESAADMEVAAEAATADDVGAAIRLTSFDLVVLDLGIPGAVGFSVLKRLRADLPDVPVLILSIAPEDQFALRAVKAGAAGYVAKRSAPEHLLDAIRRVAAGGMYFSRATGQKLAQQVMRPPARTGARAHVLSERELEVLRLLTGGKAGTVIARLLQVSPKTVSTYRRRMMSKLGVDSTASLIRYAIDQQLVDD